MSTARVPANASLYNLESQLQPRLAALEREDVVARLWRGDHTLWERGPREIPERLRWLSVVDDARAVCDEIAGFVGEVRRAGYETVLLMGMGGSSVAAEVVRVCAGLRADGLHLEVLDTTIPADIRALEERIDLERTLFLVASKSGSTVETLCHLEYFWEQVPRGEQFAAITDTGSPLAKLAAERAFRRVFLNRAEIGGRYSALSFFGLVPGALAGVDVDAVLSHAAAMLEACGPDVPVRENPGAWLGAVLGTAAQSGREKVTLAIPPRARSLGLWLEQLIAESTGKEGTGLLPVEGEPIGGSEAYGDDRLFVAVGEKLPDALHALAAQQHPVVFIPFDPGAIGAEIVRWGFAVPLACYLLGVNPFDQPNVDESKEAMAQVLLESFRAEPRTIAVRDVLRLISPGDYVALQVYLPQDAETVGRVAALRLRLRERFQVATTVGFAPRFLHSTGQYHKGGRNNGVFLQLVGELGDDLPIPATPFTFAEMTRALAFGDLQALDAHERRVTRVTLDELQSALA